MVVDSQANRKCLVGGISFRMKVEWVQVKMDGK
jgi:hypothetical protein